MEYFTLLKNIFQLLVHCTLWFIVIQLVIIPCSALLFLVAILRLSERYIYGKLLNATVLGLEEIVWMYDTPKNRPYINVVIAMKNTVNVDTFRKHVQNRMVDEVDVQKKKSNPRSTQYICKGYLNYYWVEEKNFDIKKHVYERSKKVYASVEDLQAEMSLIATLPFENNISPWEYVIIHYKDNSETKSVIMFRVHHAMADGTSLVYFLLNKLCDEISIQVKPRRFSKLQMLVLKAMAVLRIPFLSIKELFLKTPSHSLHCTNASGKKTLTWSAPIHLSLVKSIKEKKGLTVNDVLVGCLATCFNSYFKEKGEDIPDEIMTSFPVDVRASMEEASKFSNKFAIISNPLPTGSDDALKNILETQEQMRYLITTGIPLTYHATLCIINYFLPRFLTNIILSRVITKSSMILSNVAGPQVQVKIDGNDVELISFWGPTKDNIGMACSIFSYNNYVTIGYSCDKALNVRPHEILKHFPTVLSNLAKSVGVSDAEVLKLK